MEVGPRQGEAERFDQVIIAAHSDQALAMLADASDAERDILGAIPYQENLATLHTDASLLPRKRAAWASWNYHIPRKELGRVAVTYYMNRLQTLCAQVDFCVTLNRPDLIDRGKIIREITYHHPVYTRQAPSAQRRWDEKVGIAPLAAHLFLFYLACLSAVTPPLARAAQAAAAVAGASRWEVALRSARLSLAAYAIPFVLVSRPALLLEGPWPEVVLTAMVVGLGMMSIAAAVSDGRGGAGGPVQRAVFLAAGVCLLIPGWGSAATGLAVLAAAVGIALLRRRFAPRVAP